MKAIPDWLDRELTLEGWIVPDGTFLSCDREYPHPIVAMLALGSKCPDPELTAERRGWVRISFEMGLLRLQCAKGLTQAQRNTLWDWAKANECDYDEVLRLLGER